jgi:hypothetical protein
MTAPPKRRCSGGPLGPFFSITSSQPSFRAKQADFSESVRSCEPIGLRSEESLFDVPASSARKFAVSGPFSSEFRALYAIRDLCVNLFSESSSAPSLRPLRLCVIFFFLFFSLTTHHSLLTIHELRP